ncbi:MAG: proton-conducting transporter membrane subunit [Ardenticatenales bacterium]
MFDIASLAANAWLVPLFTALAFVTILIQIWTGRGGRSSAWVAIAGVGASGLYSVVVFLATLGGRAEALSHAPAMSRRLDWLPLGAGQLSFGILIDPLGAATLAMVGIACLMIFIYASAYMAGEFTLYTDPTTGAVDAAVGRARYARFFAYVSLFATGMFGFVLSSNLVQALLFWEIMGLCSFLLIGFWNFKPSAAQAAKKAFMTTRIGDMGLFIGIMMLFAFLGTTDYDTLMKPASLARLQGIGSIDGWLGGMLGHAVHVPLGSLSVAALVAICLFGGSVGKSAQFPLHVWLPDAMEGPTPVSAMIHAATMVSAGVFLIARLYPIFSSATVDHPDMISGPMYAVAAVGALTALLAATIGMAQYDIKRVLAYSTISQLGYMVMALGIGAYVAAVFHLLTHAFFKALLFLGSGSVIHGVEHGMHEAHEGHGHDQGHAAHPAHPSTILGVADADPHDPQDMRNMGGLGKRMPLTYATFLAGTLALTGIPVFSGFWSKDEILADAFHKMGDGHWIAALVWVLGTAAAFVTAFYMARQVFMVFAGPPATSGAAKAPESAPAMVYPLVVLSLFAVFLGLVGVPTAFPLIGAWLGGNPFHHYMGHLLSGGSFESHAFNALPALASIGAAASGWGLGYAMYGRRPAAARSTDPLASVIGVPLFRLLYRKYYVDELYQATVIRGSVALSNFDSWLDRTAIDGAVNGAGWIGERSSRVNNWIDSRVVDGTVALVAAVSGEMSRWMRWLQSGRIQQYLLLAFFGVLIFLAMNVL